MSQNQAAKAFHISRSTINLWCQLVIADTATFHKGGQIQSLIEAAGCQLQYLPPYSPDLNKIERCWSWLKSGALRLGLPTMEAQQDSRIRKQIAQFDCLRDAVESVLSVAS